MDTEAVKSPSHKTLISIVLLFVIASLFFLIISLKRNSENPALNLEKKKEAVVERLQNTSAKPLTREEQAQIIDFVSRGGATYTTAEKDMITKILRTQ